MKELADKGRILFIAKGFEEDVEEIGGEIFCDAFEDYERDQRFKRKLIKERVISVGDP